MRYDTIIIGAGLSGLAAGVRLSHFGKKTLILERHDTVGGLNSYYRLGGHDLDVGLHAITNYNPGGPRSAPLARLLRRLRIRYDDLGLYPQKASRIVFPGVTLEFSNEFDHLLSQIERAFPGRVDNVRALAREVCDLYERGFETEPASGRERVVSIVADPLLAEMLLTPIMFYGCASEDDIDYAQFALLFYSMFLEGFARPRDGIRHILGLLVRRYEHNGGEMRLNAGVKRVAVNGGRVEGVVLDTGEMIECAAAVSTIGHLETIAICPEAKPPGPDPQPGRMSFVETIYMLDRPAADLGADASIIFYNNSATFQYRRPDRPVDVTSGVICIPGNFCYDTPLERHAVRATHIADPLFWERADPAEYYGAKEEWRRKSLDALKNVVPDFSECVTFYDMFTPRTIRRFTGHINGAVYGAPGKVKDGLTPVKSLYLCGTDQGLVGVVGAMISGVDIVNKRLLD